MHRKDLQKRLLPELCVAPACYYDTFGYKTTLIVTGGYVRMRCWRKQGCPGGDETMELLDPDGQVIRSDICEHDRAEWRLEIDEPM